MNDKKSIIDKVSQALFQAPLEIHPNIVYMECRTCLANIDSICSRLMAEDELMQSSEKRQEVIEDIYLNLKEIKQILWTAVEVSRARNTKKDYDSEG